MIAITGLIEEIGVARDASINSIDAKNATPPKPQLRIPVRPKIKISLIWIDVLENVFWGKNKDILSKSNQARAIISVKMLKRIVAKEKTSTPGISSK